MNTLIRFGHPKPQRYGLQTLWLLAMAGACSTDPAGPDDLVCVEVTAVGSTVGDRRTLHGDAMFRFDGVERPAEVGIYLNDIEEVPDGGLQLNIVYQFSWANGDLLLTDDPVRFMPRLDPDTYAFTVELTATSGKGMFEGYEGRRLFSLNAVIEFGPPASPGGLQTAVEEFTLGGRLCPE